MTESLPTSYRRHACYEEGKGTELDYSGRDLELLIPHRLPFILFDRIRCIDLDARAIVAERTFKGEDYPFAAHFPSFPVYPGALQVEMCGQVALCLYSFLQRQSYTLPRQAEQLHVRASKILKAYYLKPLVPGDKVTIIAKEWGEHDGFYAHSLGQILINGTVACLCLQEVLFLEDFS